MLPCYAKLIGQCFYYMHYVIDAISLGNRMNIVCKLGNEDCTSCCLLISNNWKITIIWNRFSIILQLKTLIWVNLIPNKQWTHFVTTWNLGVIMFYWRYWTSFLDYFFESNEILRHHILKEWFIYDVLLLSIAPVYNISIIEWKHVAIQSQSWKHCVRVPCARLIQQASYCPVMPKLSTKQPSLQAILPPSVTY